MMQKLRFALGMICLVGMFNFASAQAGDYSLTVSSGMFTPLSSSATNVTGVQADDATAIVPIGFNFVFDGSTFDTVRVSSNGFVSFNQSSGSNAGNNLDGIAAASKPLIAPLWDDLDGRAPSSASLASYELSGTAPNRIFTFEWLYWEWRFNSSDTNVSFQVRLFEGSNEIEFAYRNEQTLPSTPSASIGLVGANSYLSVSGIGTASITTSNTAETANIDTVITDQILRFTPPSCSSPNFSSFTNITTDSITINWLSSDPGPWHIVWGPAGFTQGTATVGSDTVTIGMSLMTGGLTPNTAYDFYVRQDCGANGLSNWAGPFTATTLCVPFTAPYNESFDANSVPSCWALSATTGGPWVFTGSTNSSNCSAASDHTGNSGNYAWMDQSSTDVGVILEMPDVDVSSLTTPYLEFYYWLCGLGYTPPNLTHIEAWNGTMWTAVDTLDQGTSGWELKGYDLSTFTYGSNLVKIRFRAESGGSSGDFRGDNALDDISIKEKPICPVVTQVNTVSVSITTALVNWISAETNFNVEYGVSPYTQGSGGTVVSVTDTFALLSSLLPNTQYDFYVQTNCGTGGLSAFSFTKSFRTLCSPLVAPVTENFDALPWVPGTGFAFTNEAVDPCWSKLGGNFIWHVRSGTTPSGSTGPDTDFSGSDNYVFTEASSGSTGDTTYFVSPLINISPLTTPYFTFRYHMFGSNMGTLNVDFYDGTQWQNAVFSVNGQQQASGATAWTEGIVNLSALTRSSDTIQLRFAGIRGGGLRSDMAIDEFKVVEAPACPSPVFDSISGLDSFNATINWTSYSGNSNIEWGPQGFIQGSGTGTVILNTSPSNALASLTPNTCYDVYIQDTCGTSGVSKWIGPFSFCTPVTCPAPTNLGTDPTQLTINAAALTWTPGGNATHYLVEYGVNGFTQGSGTQAVSANDTLLVNGLNSGTEYQFYVLDSCGVGDVSVWSGPFSFITAFTTNYVNDFNNTGIPFAWSEADGKLTNNVQFTSTTASSWTSDNFGNVSGGQNGQRINLFAANQFEWLISPSIYLDPAITNLQVEFDAAITVFGNTNQGYLPNDDSLVLVISTDNGSTWSSANTLWVSDANDTLDAAGEHKVISLSGYSGYVRFGLYGGSVINDVPDMDVFVDNFEVRTPRACTSPTNIRVSTIKTDSALVSWTAGVSSAIDWSVIYTTGNQQASNGTVVNSTNDSIYLNGLTPSTSYCVYIVEQCANGFSDTIGPMCFTTLCVPFVAPYSDNMDANGWVGDNVGNSVNSVIGNCWNRLPDVTNDYSWRVRSNATGSLSTGPNADATGGNFVYTEASSGSSGDTAQLLSPWVDMSQLSNPLLRFSYHFFGSDIDKMYIAINDGNNWTNLDTISGSQQNGSADPWKIDSLDLNSYLNQTVQIRFMAISGGCCAGDLALDHFIIDDIAPLCPAPTALAAANANCDSIQLSWASDAASTYSALEYGLIGFSVGSGTKVGGVSSPYMLKGLTLDEDYEFYVVDSCGSTLGALAGSFSFKSDSIGPLVASFTSTQATTTLANATVDFDASASTNAASYAWTFDNGSNGTGVNSTATYTGNASYNVKLTVTDRCGNTDDTTVAVVVGGISVLENKYSATIDMYPNPSTGKFKIYVSNGSSDYKVEVLDMTGKLVYRQNNLSLSNEHTIDLNEKRTGVYTVRIIGEGLSVSKRLMIK